MKKWLIALAILLIVAVASVYLFIPNIIRLGREISFAANIHGVQRTLFATKNWNKWWPGDKTAVVGSDTATTFFYNGHRYAFNAKRVSLTIPISENGVTAMTSLNIIPLSGDSLKFAWEGWMTTSYNPVKRMQAWFKSERLSEDMNTILKKMQAFLVNPENVYGLYIRQEKVADSFLVSTIGVANGYPDIPFIYSLIDRLRQHVTARSGKVTGYPMLNISTSDSLKYLVMTALPVNRELAISPGIINKKMMTGAKVLTTEVTGGPSSVSAAFHQVGIFVSDYQITAPAIPFFSLITDRRLEPDTSHWVTKIYYPIM